MKNTSDGVKSKFSDANSLTVMLVWEDNCWVALGLDVYYVAYGKTLSEAKNYFEKGFVRTIEENIKRLGNADKFFNTKAPDALWKEFEGLKDSYIKTVKILDTNLSIPTIQLNYMDLKAA